MRGTNKKLKALAGTISACLMMLGVTFGSIQAQSPVQARDMPSQQQDIAITNACVQAGGTKAKCVCTTSILKYEMTFWEYEAASMLYAAEKSPQTSTISATKMALIQRGYSEGELTAIDRYRRQLLKLENFDTKCRTANSYFNKS